MADEVKKEEQTVDQETVNRLVGEARIAGRTSGEKDLLKLFGLDKADDLKALLDDHKALKAEKMTEAERATQATKDSEAAVNKANAERDAANNKLKKVSLESEAKDAAAKLGVDPAKAKQILKLLDIDIAQFDPEKPDIEAKFKTFLDLPENAHFKGSVVTTPEGGNRTRPDTTKGKGGKPDKFESLLNGMTALRG